MKKPLISSLLTLPQYVIPQHLLSRLILKLTRLQMGIISHWIIKGFIKYYDVDMSVAQSPQVQDYTHFNQFFTRALKPTARPLAKSTIISPVDGEISQIGQIDNGYLLQVKGDYFRLDDLLARNAEIIKLFKNGLFCTLYLSPKDYHRIHIPMTGRLTDMVYVPGRLFSVNRRTTQVVSNLFARNERVICLFQTEMGSMALILVGALLVGSIETVWAGTVTPNRWSQIQHWHYSGEAVPVLQRGNEMGRFNMGSTVIVLLEANRAAWLPDLAALNKIRMGQALAQPLP